MHGELEPTREPPAPKVRVGGKLIPLEKALATIRSSATWFWWIAGLSIANSAALITHQKYSLIIGLGATQIADGVAAVALRQTTGGATIAVKAIYAIIVLGAAGFFYLMGAKAREARLWAFRIGMLAYALDGCIFIFVQDWVSAGFHAFVLFMLWGGCGVARQVVAEKGRLGSGLAA
jgi:hypothetical protein